MVNLEEKNPIANELLENERRKKMAESMKKIERTGFGNPPIDVIKNVGVQVRLGELVFWAKNVIREEGGVIYERVLFCDIMTEKISDTEEKNTKVWSLYDRLKIFTIAGHMIIEYIPPISLYTFMNIPDADPIKDVPEK